MRIPRPSHVGQGSENASTMPADTFLRVICTRPSGERSKTWVLVRSLVSSVRKSLMTSSRLPRYYMSMKSMTMIPPMSRSLSWRPTSTAASLFVRNTVSSRFDFPTNLPVFTSITVIASVRSTTR